MSGVVEEAWIRTRGSTYTGEEDRRGFGLLEEGLRMWRKGGIGMKICVVVAVLAVVGVVNGVRITVASPRMAADELGPKRVIAAKAIDSAREANLEPRVVERADEYDEYEAQAQETEVPEDAMPQVQAGDDATGGDTNADTGADDAAADDYTPEETEVPEAAIPPQDAAPADDAPADDTSADAAPADDAPVDDAAPEEAPSDEAIRDFQMSCSSCVDADPMADTYDYFPDYDYDNLEPIFENSELVGLWKSCTEATGKLNSENCYVEDKYSDRISLQFTFGFSSAYNLTEPEVTSAGGAAKPEVQGYFYDEDMMGYIVIYYNCDQNTTDAFSEITVKLIVTNDYTLTFNWVKVCSSGENDHVTLMYAAEDGSDQQVAFVKEPLVVQKEDVSTTLRLTLLPPAKYQTFEAPVVTTTNDKLVAAVRGPVAVSGGDLSAAYAGMLNYQDFDVNYECKGKVKADVHVEIAIPPWDPVKATWTKICAAGGPETLAGTEAGGSNVVAGGEVMEEFQLNFAEMTSDYGDVDGLFHVSESQHDLMLYINNVSTDEDSVPITIHEVSLTQNNPSHVRAEVGSKSNPVFLTKYSPENGAVLIPGELVAGGDTLLEIQLVCLAHSNTTILVTLATVAHGNVEFGFSKACLAPTKIRESGFLRTSNSLFKVVFALVALVGVTAFFSLRKYGVQYLTSRSTYGRVPQQQ